MDFEGRELSLTRGSDIERDGMFLELIVQESRAVLADVFYSDSDGTFSLTVYDDSVPRAALAWLEEQAQLLLPPNAV